MASDVPLQFLLKKEKIYRKSFLMYPYSLLKKGKIYRKSLQMHAYSFIQKRKSLQKIASDVRLKLYS